LQEALNILVVDDEEMVREVVALLLESEGHTAHRAANGAEALERLAAGGIDLMFTDLGMPEMRGVQLIEEVLSRNLLPKHRIVAVTGMAFENPDVHWLREQKVLVLFKPFDRAALRWSLNTLLSEV
jgi:CheY-like chemotaxis protein